MSSDPLVSARIRQLQDQAAERRHKRQEATAERTEREQRQSISPRDLERQAQAAAYWKDVCDRDDQRIERERQEKIREANPTLIKLKAEYLAAPTRRLELVREFVELYRQAYRKVVDVEVLAKEWEQERRQATLQKIYGAASGAGTSEAK